MLGRWRCRIMKLGGISPIIIYDWFARRIRDTARGLYFEKVSDTERLSGYLDNHGDGRYCCWAP